MADALDFEEVFADLAGVEFPYDSSRPVKGWLVQGESHQVVFWQSKVAWESAEHSHPYAEWGVVVTGWCDITTPEGKRRYHRGDVFCLAAGVPHASAMSEDYRSMDVFFSPSHLRAQAREER